MTSSIFNRKTIFLFWGLLLMCSLVIPYYSHGQTATAQPQALLTWQAKNYIPPEYRGKSLPGPNSVVTASLEIISGGKVADLSKSNVYWYLDRTLVGSGVGKKTVSVRVGSNAPQEAELMVQIPGYKGGMVFTRVILPIAQLSATIEAPYAGNNFGGRSVNVRGVPYFFNAVDLSKLIFSWTVNGERVAATATSTDLVININPDAAVGSTLSIDLVVRDPKEDLNYATAHTTLNLAQ